MTGLTGDWFQCSGLSGADGKWNIGAGTLSGSCKFAKKRAGGQAANPRLASLNLTSTLRRPSSSLLLERSASALATPSLTGLRGAVDEVLGFLEGPGPVAARTTLMTSTFLSPAAWA